MFPTPPYDGFTWPITQHMGVITPVNLYHILWAASAYGSTDDPASNITNYVIANNLFTPNIRSDSGQPDAWRDYQQVLSELGLIVSTQVIQRITLTPIGLGYLDGSLSFSELMTFQAFRYQYPNGHKFAVANSLRSSLTESGIVGIPNLVDLHTVSGVQIRPAVLVWRLIRCLVENGEEPFLSVDEIQQFLMRCSTHKETADCAGALISARRGGPVFLKMLRGRRNAQDWITFLTRSIFFEMKGGQRGGITLSEYGQKHAPEIDDICTKLETPNSFWVPQVPVAQNRLDWYMKYGAIDIGVGFSPNLDEVVGLQPSIEYPGGAEADEIRGAGFPSAVNLREFDPESLGGSTIGGVSSATIETSYDSGLTQRSHRLHDEMVILIANICRSRGASVFDDHRSVDLLAEFEGVEHIVEVKSATSRNIVDRLRYAIGQVYHYEFLLSNSYLYNRRKVVAVAAAVPTTTWFVPFLNDHLDMDFLSLDGSLLRVDSPSERSQRLFAPI